MTHFRQIRFEPEWLPPGQDVPRHRHLEAYATVVLEGRYEQAGYSGRWIVGSGDVLIQPTLDCHTNRMISRGIWLQRLPWRLEEELRGAYRVQELDSIIRAARENPVQASALLATALPGAEALRPARDRAGDLLAAAIAAEITANRGRRIGELAEELDLVRETATRSFSRSFGISPARFAAELRTRAAWLRITGSRSPLGQVAADAGFADQAHMTRAIRAFAAQTPARLRRSVAAA